MNNYLSIRDFAKLAQVSPQAVCVAMKEGRVSKTTKGIDTTHPTNKHYIHSQDGRRTNLLKKKTTKAITIKKKVVKLPGRMKKKKTNKKSNGETPVKKKKQKKKIAKKKSDLQENIEMVEADITTPPTSEKKPLHNAQNYDAALGALNAKHLKELEQVKKLQVDTEIKRKQLVDRGVVERVFSDLYLVDTNELKTLGGKLAPRIAAAYKVDDSQKILEVERIIEKEVYRSLEHIKRILNDTLEELETELIQ